MEDSSAITVLKALCYNQSNNPCKSDVRYINTGAFVRFKKHLDIKDIALFNRLSDTPMIDVINRYKLLGKSLVIMYEVSKDEVICVALTTRTFRSLKKMAAKIESYSKSALWLKGWLDNNISEGG
jgi:hypothetical protein